MDDLQAIVWEADPETFAFTFVSARAEALLGYPARDWLADPSFWPSHIHAEDRDWAVQHCRRESLAGRDHDFEYRMVAADSRIVWVRDIVHVGRDPSERLRSLRGLLVDVTAQRRTAQALRESQTRLEVINAVAGDMVAGLTVEEIVERSVQVLSRHMPSLRVAYSTIDGSGHLRVARSVEPPGMPALSGHAADLAVVPLYLAALRKGTPVIAEDVATDSRLVGLAPALERGGTRAVLDVPLHHSDELVGLLCLDSPQPRRWNESEISMLIEIAELLSIALRGAFDREWRRQAEQALRASEERFRTLIEHSPIGIALGRGGVWLYANAAFARMYGFDDPAEVCGVSSLELVAPEDREVVADRIRRREAGESVTDAYRAMAQRRDGTPFPVLGRAMRIPLDDGPATVGFLVDLTEQERAEQALREQEERLRHAQKMEAVGQLAGGVAHDFNNLLTAILGYSDLMLKALPPEHPQREGAAAIQRAASEAARLTRQLLAFGRKQMLEARILDLNQVLAEMRDMLARVVGENIELEIRPGSGLWRVLVDPGQLQQVILNLAVNARDAMPKGGRLTLATANVEVGASHPARSWDVSPGAYVEMTVRDTGIGMEAATLARVFEPFFTTKGVGRGTGLGLASVYGIVRQSGGSIAVVSAPGEGATFHVYFPRTGEPLQGTTEAAAGAMPGAGETVLLVEDDPAVRRVVRDMLARHGYTVLEAGGPEEALERVRQDSRPIGLILSDIVMPGRSGPEMVEELLQERPGTRVLYMSAHSEEVLSLRGLGKLQAPFLIKPFTARDLVERVQDVLGAPRTEAASPDA